MSVRELVGWGVDGGLAGEVQVSLEQRGRAGWGQGLRWGEHVGGLEGGQKQHGKCSQLPGLGEMGLGGAVHRGEVGRRAWAVRDTSEEAERAGIGQGRGAQNEGSRSGAPGSWAPGRLRPIGSRGREGSAGFSDELRRTHSHLSSSPNPTAPHRPGHTVLWLSPLSGGLRTGLARLPPAWETAAAALSPRQLCPPP